MTVIEEIAPLYGLAHVDLPLNAADHEERQSARREDGNVPLAILLALLRAMKAREEATV